MEASCRSPSMPRVSSHAESMSLVRDEKGERDFDDDTIDFKQRQALFGSSWQGVALGVMCLTVLPLVWWRARCSIWPASPGCHGPSSEADVVTVHAGIAELGPGRDMRREGKVRKLDHNAGPVLVTGGAGFVGFHLTQRLASEGHRVVALDDFNPYYSSQLKRDRAAQLRERYGAHVRVVDMDLCDGKRLNQLFDEFSFTHVVNLAAQAGVRYSLQQPQAYIRANLRCFIELLEVLRNRPHVILVYASSSSVYGANRESPFSEMQRVDSPNSLYAASKKANEAMALVYHQLYNISCTGLRFFTVYGPWGRPDMAYFSFAYKMLKRQTITVYGHGKPRRDFTYIDDIVTGVEGAMALAAPYEVFNLGNNEPVGLMYFIRVLERELKVKANLNFTAMAPGDVLSTHADVERAGRLLGYKPTTSIEAGLHKFVQWFKSPLFKEEYALDGLWRTGHAWDRYANI